eukprot:gene23058-30247_t
MVGYVWPSVIKPQSARPPSAPSARKNTQATNNGTNGALSEDSTPPSQKSWTTGLTSVPTTQNLAGREQFLQTPAFVIASSYVRGDSVAKQNKMKELTCQLSREQRYSSDMKKASLSMESELDRCMTDLSNARHENAMLWNNDMKKASLTMESELDRCTTDLSNARHENAMLWNKCENMSKQLLHAHRDAKEMKESKSLLSEQFQNFKMSSKGTRMIELKTELRESHLEIERLNKIIAAQALKLQGSKA